MTDTTITPIPVEDEVHLDLAFDRNAAETIEAVIDGDTDRIAVLKRELADELSRRIYDVESHLEVVDREIDALTARRRHLVVELKAHQQELSRIVGTPKAQPATAPQEPGSFPCPEPSCGKTFVSKQGAATHHTRSHKKAAAPTLSAVPPPCPGSEAAGGRGDAHRVPLRGARRRRCVRARGPQPRGPVAPHPDRAPPAADRRREDPRHPRPLTRPMLDVRPAWQADALCNTGDGALVDVFFGRGRRDFDGERAKQICAGCPVQAECLDHALTVADSDGQHTPAPGAGGVWGGHTHLERIELRRNIGATA